MQNYFPYSQLISNLPVIEKPAVVRTAFVGDWQVFENKDGRSATRSRTAIAEIYY